MIIVTLHVATPLADRHPPCRSTYRSEQRVSDLRYPLVQRLELGDAVVAVHLFQQDGQGIHVLGFGRRDDNHGGYDLSCPGGNISSSFSSRTGGRVRVALGSAATI